MEAEAVLDIYIRSVANYDIWYDLFIGDSSSFCVVDIERSYGVIAFVQK